MKKTIIAITIAAACIAPPTKADFFQASLTPEIAIHSRDTRIEGISLSIWGENPQSSFAFGFINGSTGKSAGLAWGLVNYSDSYTGVELGIVNYSKETFIGLQSGLVNIGKEVNGLQWGTVNYAESLNGVQLGLVCIVKENAWFKEFPSQLSKGFVFLNWSF